MKFFFRIVALVLAFWLPISGFASIQNVCEHPAAEAERFVSAGHTALQADVTADEAVEYQGSKQADVELLSFGPCEDGGHQCPTGILPPSLTLSAPLVPNSPFVYEKSLARVFLEHPQRPPSLYS